MSLLIQETQQPREYQLPKGTNPHPVPTDTPPLTSEAALHFLSNLNNSAPTTITPSYWSLTPSVGQAQNTSPPPKTQWTKSRRTVTDVHGTYDVTLLTPAGLMTLQEEGELFDLIAKLNPFLAEPVKMFVWNQAKGGAYNPKHHSVHLGRQPFSPTIRLMDQNRAAMVHEMGHGLYQKGAFSQDADWDVVFRMALGHGNYEVIDDSTYLNISDLVGHPFANENEAFASAVHAYFLQADAFRDCLFNPQVPTSRRRFGQLVWLYMRDRVFKGQVFTSDGQDPLKNSDFASVLSKMNPDHWSSLRAALNDQEEQVQKSALDQLILLGSESVPVIAELVTVLRTARSPRRRQAARVLGLIGGPAAPLAVPALLELVAGPGELLRLVAIRTLGELGPEAIHAVPALIEAASEDSVNIRQAAQQALQQIVP